MKTFGVVVVCLCAVVLTLAGCRTSPTARETELAAEVARLTQENKDLRKELSRLAMSNIRSGPIRISPSRPPDGGARSTRPPRVIRGAVKAVDASLGVVVLNVGSENDPPVKKGYRFRIYHDQTFVAVVKVLTIEKKMCAAEIVPPKTGIAIQVRDLAFTEF